MKALQLLALVALVLVATLFAGPATAAKEQVNCDVLIGKAYETGKVPQVSLDQEWGLARMTMADLSCREPIEEWHRREISWPVKIINQAKKSNVPGNTPKASIDLPQKQAKTPRLPADQKPCDQTLEKYWSQGRHTIGGVDYWLAEVFTLDLDDDGITDNLGFKMMAEGQNSLIIRYFGIQGQIAARQIPDLALPDDDLVGRFCFAKISLDEPFKKTQQTTIVPNLADEIQARMAPPPKKTKAKAKHEPGQIKDSGYSFRLWSGMGMGIGIVIIVIGGAIVIGLVRRNKRSGEDVASAMDTPFADRNMWPLTDDETIDWEVLFEKQEIGFIAVVLAAEDPQQLKQQAQSICQAVFNRKRDKNNIKKVAAFLEKVIPEDAPEENLPAMQASIVKMLHGLKDNRIKRVAAYNKKGKKKGNRRSHPLIDIIRYNTLSQIALISILVIFIPLGFFMATQEDPSPPKIHKGDIRQHIRWIDDYVFNHLSQEIWQLLSVRQTADGQITIDIMLNVDDYVAEINKMEQTKRLAVLQKICPDAGSDVQKIIEQGWDLWVNLKSHEELLIGGQCRY